MENLNKVIDDILKKSDATSELSETEQKNLKVAIGFDLNQFLIDTLYALLESDDLEKIEELITKNDQTGMQDLLDEIRKNKEIAKTLDIAIKEYSKDIIEDLKKLKKMMKDAKKK